MLRAAVATVLMTALFGQSVHSDVVDLTNARIVVGSPNTPLMQTAADTLASLVFDRTSLRWPVVNATPGNTSGGLVVLSALSPLEVDRSSARAEGYTLKVDSSGSAPVVSIIGVDGRGTL